MFASIPISARFRAHATADLSEAEMLTLTRVPCVGEFVAHVMGMTDDDKPYRVVRVLHLREPSDTADRYVAEIVCEAQ